MCGAGVHFAGRADVSLVAPFCPDPLLAASAFSTTVVNHAGFRANGDYAFHMGAVVVAPEAAMGATLIFEAPSAAISR